MKTTLLIIAVAALALSAGADPIFMTNTFNSGNEGWQPWSTSTDKGISPNNPYLKIAADGVGVFGKMITFNANAEWTGNYHGTGVNGLRLDISNMSDSDDVFLRVALGNRASPQQTGGTWWLSTTAVHVPLESGWTSIFLPILESEMVVVGNLSGEAGTDSFEDTLRDIRNIRILSASIPVSPIGDEFVGDVAIDNVALVPEPTTLPMIGIGTAVILLIRQRKPGELSRWVSRGQ